MDGVGPWATTEVYDEAYGFKVFFAQLLFFHASSIFLSVWRQLAYGGAKAASFLQAISKPGRVGVRARRLSCR